MFFLLRVAFWLTIVLAVLPTGSSRSNSTGPGAGETVAAAGAAVSDMSHFCQRQAEACQVGTQAVALIGERAQAGAKMIYDLVQEQMARSETGSIAKPHSKTQPPQFAGSQSTLHASDLEPAWQGPPSRIENVPLPRPRRSADTRTIARNG